MTSNKASVPQNSLWSSTSTCSFVCQMMVAVCPIMAAPSRLQWVKTLQSTSSSPFLSSMASNLRWTSKLTPLKLQPSNICMALKFTVAERNYVSTPVVNVWLRCSNPASSLTLPLSFWLTTMALPSKLLYPHQSQGAH